MPKFIKIVLFNIKGKNINKSKIYLIYEFLVTFKNISSQDQSFLANFECYLIIYFEERGPILLNVEITSSSDS